MYNLLVQVNKFNNSDLKRSFWEDKTFRLVIF